MEILILIPPSFCILPVYIFEKEPLTNRFVSLSKHHGQLNCAAFLAGLIRGVLTGSNFVSPTYFLFNFFSVVSLAFELNDFVVVVCCNFAESVRVGSLRQRQHCVFDLRRILTTGASQQSGSC